MKKQNPVLRFFRDEPLRLTPFYYLFHSLVYFLSQLRTDGFHTVYCAANDLIPFIPWFIIPYVLWYFYLAFGILYTFFCGNRRQLWRQAVLTLGGAFVCLIVCIIYPSTFPGRGDLAAAECGPVAARLLSFIYGADRPINVLPSMHCQGAISTHLVLRSSDLFKNRPWLRVMSLIFAVTVCFATVFVKQHSVIDVLAALILSALLCIPAYITVPEYVKKGSRTE